MRVGIVGSGLIGGSIGLALKNVPEVDSVVVFDRDAVSAARAVERGAADETIASLSEFPRDCAVVFVAIPVGGIPDVVRELQSALNDGTIVTDVGSTKSRVVDEVTNFLRPGLTFIGGHPMAGSEEDGIEGASATLFEDAWWILTPTEAVDAGSYQTLHGLVSSMGCQVLALEPAQHDELMAIISHLPHLTAATLMNMAASHGKAQASLLALAAGGFRDVTRVAASNPTIWIDICRENRDAIARALGEFAERLSDLRVLIESGRLDDLRSALLTARSSRRSLGGKRVDGTVVEIVMPIPDRPGVLAEVTTLVGRLGVNIEDIQISHAEEGGHGLLRLMIMGVEESTKVLHALEMNGFHPRALSL